MASELEEQFFKSLGLKPINIFVEYLKHYFQKLKQQVQALFKEE